MFEAISAMFFCIYRGEKTAKICVNHPCHHFISRRPAVLSSLAGW